MISFRYFLFEILGTVVELLTAAGNGTRQALEVLLKMREDLLRIILSGVTGLALILVGTIADIVGLLLGQTHDLLLRGDGERLLLGIGDDGVRLGGSACEQLLALLDDAAGLLPLLRIAHANLIEDVEEHVCLDNLLLRALAERRACLLDNALELIDQALDALTREVIDRHEGLLSADYSNDSWYHICLYFRLRLVDHKIAL